MAYYRVRGDARSFMANESNFKAAKMDIDLIDWREMSDDVKEMKIAHAAKHAVKGK